LNRWAVHKSFFCGNRDKKSLVFLFSKCEKYQLFSSVCSICV
jgi:hypothetical protein